MKRRIVIAVAVIAVIVTTFGCAKSPKTDKALEPLPAGIEGVEVVGDTLRKKPGFEWVKQPDGTVIVQRPANTGSGVVIRVGCGCDTGSYACEAVIINDTTLKCQNVRDCLSCKWFKPDVDATRK